MADVYKQPDAADETAEEDARDTIRRETSETIESALTDVVQLLASRLPLSDASVLAGYSSGIVRFAMKQSLRSTLAAILSREETTTEHRAEVLAALRDISGSIRGIADETIERELTAIDEGFAELIAIRDRRLAEERLRATEPEGSA